MDGVLDRPLKDKIISNSASYPRLIERVAIQQLPRESRGSILKEYSPISPDIKSQDLSNFRLMRRKSTSEKRSTVAPFLTDTCAKIKRTQSLCLGKTTDKIETCLDVTKTQAKKSDQKLTKNTRKSFFQSKHFSKSSVFSSRKSSRNPSKGSNSSKSSKENDTSKRCYRQNSCPKITSEPSFRVSVSSTVHEVGSCRVSVVKRCESFDSADISSTERRISLSSDRKKSLMSRRHTVNSKPKPIGLRGEDTLSFLKQKRFRPVIKGKIIFFNFFYS